MDHWTVVALALLLSTTYLLMGTALGWWLKGQETTEATPVLRSPDEPVAHGSHVVEYSPGNEPDEE